MREIVIIAAMAENRVIGKNNALPWSLKEDMAHFRQLTNGWPCIMGRKTWESLPKKPLPGRLNIVISGTMTEDSLPAGSPVSRNVKIFPSLQAAAEHCAGYERIFICGGETVYRQALNLADKIELTVIHKHYEGDAFFPEIEPAFWNAVKTVNFDTFSFITYTRTSNSGKEQL
ncbi:MAG: dihydrofolate reductase [Treponema sp.]|jgi:dihydrofolate reductase|nr:dihydrofolate reductase [Treponema sp.]